MDIHEMNRLDILSQALHAVQVLEAEFPSSRVLHSASGQLRYLIDLEMGCVTDRSQLESINLGVIAAREVEDMSPSAAQKLHAASRQAQAMRGE
ncbi:MAG: hypothetical protein JSS36_03210 [Proteobacteria bacterium]|nr:hypothetical protein [Pseudomonadota bacterium]